MNIKAKLTLKDTKLLWQETTLCYTELFNDSDEEIINVNPDNWRGGATFCLTNLLTGEKTYHSRKLLPEIESAGISLASGGMLTDEIVLSSILRFPTSGLFELQAKYSFDGGEVESAPVRVEVIRADPQGLVTETAMGSQAGDLYCVWTNRLQDGFDLYLSTIDTAFEPIVLSTNKIGKLSMLCEPSISIPANKIPARQHVAWIAGDKLHYVICETGGLRSGSLELNSREYKIVPPLLEDVGNGNTIQFAEVLLTSVRPDGWRLRTVLLDGSPSFADEIRTIHSIPPEWFQTVYRSTGERYTFFILPQSRDGNPYLKLAMSMWRERVAPSSPVFLSNWNGSLVAADILLAADDRIVGAVLLKREDEGRVEFVVEKWTLDQNDELRVSTTAPIRWNEDWIIEHAFLRVNGDGVAFMLFKGGPESKWYWVDGAGDFESLGDLSSRISLPADIIFTSFIYPAIVYTDKECGLRFHYLGPNRVYRPPTGSW